MARPPTNAGEIYVHIGLPIVLRERAKLVAKKLNINFSDIIREGLRERLEYLLGRIELEEARDRKLFAESKSEKKAKTPRLSKRVGRLGESEMSPVTLEDSGEEQAPSTAVAIARATPEPYDVVIESYAKQIASTDDTTERRVLLQECLASIRRRAPLTAPPDKVLIERLEKEVLRLLDEIDKAKATVIAGGEERVVKDVPWAGDI